jgi:hypothetical protein
MPVEPDQEAAAPEIFEAERMPGPDGAVERGDAPITEAEAVARLKAGLDVVVCGAIRRANRNKARELANAAFGGNEEEEPHEGRMALHHFHPPDHTPEGVHVFFDTPQRYARKKKKKK